MLTADDVKANAKMYGENWDTMNEESRKDLLLKLMREEIVEYAAEPIKIRRQAARDFAKLAANMLK